MPRTTPPAPTGLQALLAMSEVTMLTVRQVAERLQASERTVRRAIASGELAVHRIGAAVRVSEADLAAFLAARRQG